MEYKDYYKELGVEKTATEAEIKKAYRKLVRKYHPDVSKEPDADKRTKALNEAYGVLGDAEKRAAYDELGRNQGAQGQPFRPPPDWGSGYESSGADDSDFFADLFAHVGGRRRAGGSFQMQGEDSHAAITNSFEYNCDHYTTNQLVPQTCVSTSYPLVEVPYRHRNELTPVMVSTIFMIITFITIS